MHIIDKLQSTLGETSCDEGVPMINSELKVCSFDKVKEWYVSEKVPYANQFKHYFFKNVYTYTAKEFEQYFMKKYRA